MSADFLQFDATLKAFTENPAGGAIGLFGSYESAVTPTDNNILVNDITKGYPIVTEADPFAAAAGFFALVDASAVDVLRVQGNFGDGADGEGVYVNSLYATAPATTNIGSVTRPFNSLFVTPSALDGVVFDVKNEPNAEIDIWNTAAPVGNSVAFIHFATSDTGFGPLHGASVGLHIPNGLAIYMRDAYRIYFGVSDAHIWQMHEVTGAFAPWDDRSAELTRNDCQGNPFTQGLAPANDGTLNIGDNEFNRAGCGFFKFDVTANQYGLASTTQGAVADVLLQRLGANSLALKNGTAPQTFTIQDTTTGDTKAQQYWNVGGGTAGNDEFLTQVSSGSQSPDITWGTNGSRQWRILGSAASGVTGDFIPVSDNANNIGQKGGKQPAVVFSHGLAFSGLASAGQGLWNLNAGNVKNLATGGAATIPLLAQGFLQIQIDSAGTLVNIPFFNPGGS